MISDWSNKTKEKTEENGIEEGDKEESACAQSREAVGIR